MIINEQAHSTRSDLLQHMFVYGTLNALCIPKHFTATYTTSKHKLYSVRVARNKGEWIYHTPKNFFRQANENQDKKYIPQ